MAVLSFVLGTPDATTAPARASPRFPTHLLAFPAGMALGNGSDAFEALEVGHGMAVADRPIDAVESDGSVRSGVPLQTSAAHEAHAACVAQLIQEMQARPSGAAVLTAIRELAPLGGTRNQWRSRTPAGETASSIRVVIFPSPLAQPLSHAFPLSRPAAAGGEGSHSAVRFAVDAARTTLDASSGRWLLHTPHSELVHELIHTAHFLSGASAMELPVQLFSQAFTEQSITMGPEPKSTGPNVAVTTAEEPLTVGSPSDRMRLFRAIVGPGKTFTASEYPAESAVNPFLARRARDAALRAQAGTASPADVRLAAARAELARANPTENSYRSEVGLPLRELYRPGRLSAAGHTWTPVQEWGLRPGRNWGELGAATAQDLRRIALLRREVKYRVTDADGKEVC